jgi:renalase
MESGAGRARAQGARPRVVVVGAGMAGLIAARQLRHDHDVIVLDKSRGVGGRMATRRIGDATFDHGAQFLTTHTAEFAAIVGEWSSAGVVAPWFTGRAGPDGVTESDGHVRYRGVGTMNDIAKHLAESIVVNRSQRVHSIAVDGGSWELRCDGVLHRADAVVLTAPVPQSLDLLEAGGITLDRAVLEAMRAIEYDPCLAVMAPLDGPSGVPEPGVVDPTSGPVDLIADNRLKGVSATDAVTIHATPEASRSMWEAGDAEVCTRLTAAAGIPPDRLAGGCQVQRWRYARPVEVHPERCVLAHTDPPLVLAGDAFGGPKVEGAALSGLAAAAAVRSVLG